VAIWQHYRRVLGIFSLRKGRHGYLRTSGQKSDPAIRSGDLDFLYDTCIFTTEWRLRDIFDVFVIPRHMTLWPWTLTFWPWECHVFLISDPHTNFYYPMTIGYWVKNTELITLPSPGMVTAHAPCHVTYHRGAKMIHILEIPDPNLPIHFVTFRELRQSLSHVICEK